jgi:hypothetical protein
MAQLIKAAKPTKKSVADPSDSYHSLKPLWKKARAVLQGEDNAKAHDEFVRDKDNLLIPFSPSMTQEQYEFYKKEAELPGLVAQYCKVLITSLLRKKSQLTLPEDLPEDAIDWIETNFTLDGRGLFNFLDTALWEELQTSRCWVYVDYPNIAIEEWEAMSTEDKEVVSPYPVVIKAENVINYQTSIHPITRIKSITRFVTRYIVEEYTDVENPWHPEYQDVVADHYLDESGGLVIDYYKREYQADNVKILNGEVSREFLDRLTEAKFVKYDTVYPTMWGERVPKIPAWPLNGQIEPIEPVLMPLIDREISLYNKISRRNHLLYGAATYTPIVKSDMSDDEFQEIVNAGLGTWLRVRKDEDISVLQTPTAALSDMDRSIKETVEDMAKMGIRMLSPEQAASGVALEIRNASQTAQLGSLNAKISSTMREIIAFMLNWKYNRYYTGNDINFQMSADFSPIVGGEGSMRLVTEWYREGFIPRSVFLNIAKYNDFLPADYDDESAIAEIQTDSLVAGSQQNQPQLDVMETEA